MSSQSDFSRVRPATERPASTRHNAKGVNWWDTTTAAVNSRTRPNNTARPAVVVSSTISSPGRASEGSLTNRGSIDATAWYGRVLISMRSTWGCSPRVANVRIAMATIIRNSRRSMA